MAAAVPLPAIAEAVEKGVDLGMGECKPEKYFITWWDKAELDAFISAFHPLAESAD